MTIRRILENEIGGVGAGCWQATVKVSELFIVAFTATLGTHYLPRISKSHTRSSLRREMWLAARFMVPCAVLGATAIIVSRTLLIDILFSREFLPMSTLLPWQLAGDVTKVGAWIFAYILIGQELGLLFVITEIMFAALHVILVVTCVRYLGFAGVSIAYFLTYLGYLLLVAWIALRHIRLMPNDQPVSDCDSRL
jgi:PST family polysaccharide transporter